MSDGAAMRGGRHVQSLERRDGVGRIAPAGEIGIDMRPGHATGGRENVGRWDREFMAFVAVMRRQIDADLPIPTAMANRRSLLCAVPKARPELSGVTAINAPPAASIRGKASA